MSSPKRTRSIWKRETLLAPAECERQAGGITGTSLWTSSTCEVCALHASAKPKGCTAGYQHSIHDPPHPPTAEKETNLVRSHQYKMCGLLFKVFALCQAYIGRGRKPNPDFRKNKKVTPLWSRTAGAVMAVLHSGAPRSCNKIALLLGREPWVAGNNRAYPKGVHFTTSSGR